MNSSNEDRPQSDNMESLRQQAQQQGCCAPGCGCNSPGSSSKSSWIIGVIVLLAAGALVVRAAIKGNGAPGPTPSSDFASPGASTTKPASAIELPAPEVDPAAASTQPPSRQSEPSVGTAIAAFAELNTKAADTDAVFVFLPGKNNSADTPPSTPMRDAARMLGSQGVRCALFTLKAGTRDHDDISAQIRVPAVLAMVKGAGMQGVTGDITESKLIQGFVAASRTGGCGAGGCGPSGCR